MRNSLVHGYFDADREAVWAVAKRDLGPLIEAVEEMQRVEGDEQVRQRRETSFREGGGGL